MRKKVFPRKFESKFFLNIDKYLVAAAAVLSFVIAFTVPVFGSDKSANTGPKIQILKKTHDFGLAVEGEEVVYDFFLINAGTATLEIQKVKTD
jgi:hypothetical protein